MSVDIKVSEIIDKVFAGFKKITPALIVLDIVASCILFMPGSFLSTIGVQNMPAVWRTICGIIFLFSTALIVVVLLSPLVDKMKRRYRENQLWMQREKEWASLPQDSKVVVCALLAEPSKSGFLIGTSAVTAYLFSKGFIFRPQQHVNIDYEDLAHQRFVYCLSIWVIDLYEKKPDLFDMSSVDPGLLQPMDEDALY